MIKTGKSAIASKAIEILESSSGFLGDMIPIVTIRRQTIDHGQLSIVYGPISCLHLFPLA